MKMSRVLMIVALFAMGWTISAQAHGKGGRKGQHNGGLTEALGLSEEQQGQLEELKGQHMEQKQALHEEHRQVFEAILTPEQLAALEEFRASNPKRGRHRGARLDLGLSQEQLGQLEELKGQHMEEWQALRDGYREGLEAILTAEQLATLEDLKAERGCHKGDKAEDGDGGAEDETDTQTSKVALQVDLGSDGAPTAVEETSWGRVKDQVAR